ncbi:MAG: hypothetical protein FWF06_07160, partial [Symbiobacteriaceae bacterium]|nr:hypothetical protein [Symbiobacteriaceae bacterium]
EMESLLFDIIEGYDFSRLRHQSVAELSGSLKGIQRLEQAIREGLEPDLRDLEDYHAKELLDSYGGISWEALNHEFQAIRLEEQARNLTLHNILYGLFPFPSGHQSGRGA